MCTPMMPRILALTLLVATLVFAPLVALDGSSAMAHSAEAETAVSLDHCGHAVDGDADVDGTQPDQGCATMCAIQGSEPKLPELALQPSSTMHPEWQQTSLGSTPEQEPPPPR